MNFDVDFKEAAIIRLEENYRSTRNILKAASSVIKNNIERKGKQLFGNREKGELLTLIEVADEKEEARSIVNKIRSYRASSSILLKDFALLYRTNAQSRALEEGLRKSGIPYTLVGATQFYARKEIKDILAYLKLIANPQDTVSLKRIINVPKRDIGDASVSNLEMFAFEHALQLHQCFERVDEIENISVKKKKKLRQFWSTITKYKKLSLTQSVLTLTTALLEEIGYMAMFSVEGDSESIARLENVRELLVGMEEFAERSEDNLLHSFLSEVSLMTDVDSWNDRADVVTLMTLHCAKGLEFPIVFITGLEEGLFPLANAFEDDDKVEEERRLFYVGITRAQQKVFLTSALHRRRYEHMMPNVLSRFVDEIPNDILEKEKVIPSQITDKNDATRLYKRKMPGLHKDRIEVGMQVQHPTFGKGRVVTKRGIGDNARVTVHFRETGTKNLFLKYAQLESKGV